MKLLSNMIRSIFVIGLLTGSALMQAADTGLSPAKYHTLHEAGKAAESLSKLAQQEYARQILCLPTVFTTNDVKKNYRKYSLVWHPDKNRDGDAEAIDQAIKAINFAYKALEGVEWNEETAKQATESPIQPGPPYYAPSYFDMPYYADSTFSRPSTSYSSSSLSPREKALKYMKISSSRYFKDYSHSHAPSILITEIGQFIFMNSKSTYLNKTSITFEEQLIYKNFLITRINDGIDSSWLIFDLTRAYPELIDEQVDRMNGKTLAGIKSRIDMGCITSLPDIDSNPKADNAIPEAFKLCAAHSSIFQAYRPERSLGLKPCGSSSSISLNSRQSVMSVTSEIETTKYPVLLYVIRSQPREADYDTPEIQIINSYTSAKRFYDSPDEETFYKKFVCICNASPFTAYAGIYKLSQNRFSAAHNKLLKQSSGGYRCIVIPPFSDVRFKRPAHVQNSHALITVEKIYHMPDETHEVKRTKLHTFVPKQYTLLTELKHTTRSVRKAKFDSAKDWDSITITSTDHGPGSTRGPAIKLTSIKYARSIICAT